MGGPVTVQVRHLDGSSVSGARVLAINHDAWSKRYRKWHGTTDRSGNCTWRNLGSRTLGNRFALMVVAKDTDGGRWAGEASLEIEGETTVTLTVAPATE
ncbi:MAG: hypothetical protein WA691_06110 [Thermoplasmata archaeon]